MSLRHIYTKIAGVSHANVDGTERQDLVKRLKPGERLKLVREPDNAYDPNAVAIQTDAGQQAGYITRRAAEDIAEWLDAGDTLEVFVIQVTGGGPGKSFGCNIVVVAADDDENDEAIVEYAADCIKADYEEAGYKVEARVVHRSVEEPTMKEVMASKSAAGTRMMNGSAPSVAAPMRLLGWGLVILAVLALIGGVIFFGSGTP